MKLSLCWFLGLAGSLWAAPLPDASAVDFEIIDESEGLMTEKPTASPSIEDQTHALKNVAEDLVGMASNLGTEDSKMPSIDQLESLKASMAQMKGLMPEDTEERFMEEFSVLESLTAMLEDHGDLLNRVASGTPEELNSLSTEDLAALEELKGAAEGLQKKKSGGGSAAAAAILGETGASGGQGCPTLEALMGGLKLKRFMKHLDSLFGVETVADLALLDEEDFKEAGMKKVQIKKLLAAASETNCEDGGDGDDELAHEEL